MPSTSLWTKTLKKGSKGQKRSKRDQVLDFLCCAFGAILAALLTVGAALACCRPGGRARPKAAIRTAPAKKAGEEHTPARWLARRRAAVQERAAGGATDAVAKG